ncbi:tetratricopeptide repeat protein [Leptothoe sp. ISB3NOV94-8A]|nr:tetratricopeptide repeat protein [Adonisia turfae]MDV3352904.1 tetratricopeptide repeat protein [Leptothoe sp. LEGE 181152]
MAKQWLWSSLLGLSMLLPGTVALAQIETTPEPEDAYTQAMNLGYTYANQFDYQTALINFRRALEERPDDVYALNAIANMEYYIKRNRLDAIQAEVDTLQARLNLAAQTKDWVCVTATVDELIPYAEGLERERLTGYRSQLTGVLDSRTDVEFWSTVCSPDQPLQ